MLEVTVNDSQGAVVGDVALEVLTLEGFTTFVSTWQRIVATHRPVDESDNFVGRVEVLAILAAERSDATLVTLMDLNNRS